MSAAPLEVASLDGGAALLAAKAVHDLGNRVGWQSDRLRTDAG